MQILGHLVYADTDTLGFAVYVSVCGYRLYPCVRQAALGGWDRTHGLAVGAFKQSCTNDSHNEPRTVVWMCDCRTAVGLSDLSDLSDPHLTVSDSTRTCDRSELLSDTVGLLSDTVGPVGLSDCRTCRTVGLLSEVTVGLSDQGSGIA